MSYTNVKNYFESVGLGDQLVVREQIGDTVEHAAESIGCEPARIAKTMSFFINELPALIVMAGDAKVQNGKFKEEFHQKAVMLPFDQVEELTGHEPGAVCPFALKDNVKVYLDVSLKRFDYVYTAGGSLNSTVRLTLEQLEEHSKYEKWIDVCKGWLTNENI